MNPRLHDSCDWDEPVHYSVNPPTKDNAAVSEKRIGEIAGLSMFVSVLFLLLQVPVWIVVMITDVILENHHVSQQNREVVCGLLFLLCECVIILTLYLKIRQRWFYFVPDPIVTKRNSPGIVFNEKILERCFNILAVIGIAWILIMGMSFESIKVFHVVIQGFATLFFAIFLALRLILTRAFSFRTFFSVILSMSSIVLAFVLD